MTEFEKFRARFVFHCRRCNRTTFSCEEHRQLMQELERDWPDFRERLGPLCRQKMTPEQLSARSRMYYERSRELRKQRTAAGLCTHCGKRKARYRMRLCGRRGEKAVRQAQKYMYGIDLKQQRQLWRLQEGLCANKGCGARLAMPGKKKPQAGEQRANIDHCHESGAVRFLLCRSCNLALGLLREAPAALRGLADIAEECQSLLALYSDLSRIAQ